VILSVTSNRRCKLKAIFITERHGGLIAILKSYTAAGAGTAHAM